MSKRRLPYIQFWVDDYERDTRHLKTAEHGAYLLLLMAAWKSPTSSLPDDDDMLARIVGVSAAEWAGMKKIVMGFWKLDGRSKRWVNKRLKKERRLALDRSDKGSDAAASRWNKKKNDDAQPMLERCHTFITTDKKPNGFSKRAGAQKKSAKDELMEAFENV